MKKKFIGLIHILVINMVVFMSFCAPAETKCPSVNYLKKHGVSWRYDDIWFPLYTDGESAGELASEEDIKKFVEQIGGFRAAEWNPYRDDVYPGHCFYFNNRSLALASRAFMPDVKAYPRWEQISDHVFFCSAGEADCMFSGSG